MPTLTPRPVSDLVREAFRCLLPIPLRVEPSLAGALEHTLSHHGSLVRARLVLHMSRAYGLVDGQGLPLAVAVEYFHTASLLFDDLPCMDDATDRRGASCVHVRFGEAPAILAALSLINRAYALVWESMNGLPEERRRTGAAYLESCLGLRGVLNGQAHDLQYGRAPSSAMRVLWVAMEKTVPLIRMALVFPALLAGAPSGELRRWRQLAVWWGLSYQMLDDLKDLHGAPPSTGKTGQRDRVLRRPNLVLAEGNVKTARRVNRLVALGERALAGFGGKDPRWDFLDELRQRLGLELKQYASASASAAAA